MKKLILSILVACPGFASAQVLEWSYVLADSGNSWDWDEGSKVLLDGVGGVYVLGNLINPGGSGGEWDIALIKLDTAGNEEWIYLYDGLVHGNDKASDMILDSHGNVYITGYAYAYVDSLWSTDLAVLKLDTSGTEKWVYLYDVDTIGNSDEYGYSITLDSSGNIYTAGGVGFYDGAFLVLSLDTTGAFRWSYVYRHENGNDPDKWHRATQVITDSVGGVYVCGCLVDSGWISGYEDVFEVIKLDTAGNLLWKYFGPDFVEGFYMRGFMELDGSGHLFGVASGESWGWFAMAYFLELDTAGNVLWQHPVMPIGNLLVRDMSLKGGGTYYCGEGIDNGGVSSTFTVTKISLVGSFRWWQAFWVDSGFSTSCASDLELNDRGGLIAVGDTGDYGLAVKLDTAGNLKWTYDWPGRSWFSSVALDSAGGIYIAGAVDQDSLTREKSTDILVIKLRDTATTVAEKPRPGKPGLSLSASPNPAHGPVSILLGLPGESPYSLKLYDPAGRLVEVISEGRGYESPVSLEWAPDEPAGLYFMRLEAGCESSQESVVIE